MGTLFNQQPRMETRNGDDPMAICYANTLAKKLVDLKNEYGIKESTAIEILKLSVKITDHDIKDEQLSGFGELFSQLSFTK